MNPQKISKECYVCKSLFPSSVDMYDGEANGILRFYSEEMSMLVFVLSGNVTLTISNICENKRIEKNNLFLLPLGGEGYIKILSNNTKLLVYRFNTNTFYCVRHFLIQLGHPNENALQNIHVLPINDPLQDYLNSLQRLLKSKKYCSHYYDLIVEEIIIYLNGFYPSNELSLLFGPILGHDSEFKSFVYANYRKANNVKELAEMKNMTLVTFNRYFVRAFGISASNWIRERRKDEILRDIMLTDLSFTELAFKYNFSSSAYFTIFCKNNWGKTPSEIRFNQKTT